MQEEQAVAPAQMTDEQAVTAVHRDAHAWPGDTNGWYHWHVNESRRDGNPIIGEGATKELAWADARRRLASTGAETERAKAEEIYPGCKAIAPGEASGTTWRLWAPHLGVIARAATEEALWRIAAPQQFPVQEQGAVTLPALRPCAPMTDEEDVRRAHIEQREEELLAALQKIATLRAELDEAQNATIEAREAYGEEQRTRLFYVHKCETAEAARDAYKAALEKIVEALPGGLGAFAIARAALSRDDAGAGMEANRG